MCLWLNSDQKFHCFSSHQLLFLSRQGSHGGVSEEDRGQCGSYLHQQRHSILHGSAHPHPSAQSLFSTGTVASEWGLYACVCVCESSVVWGLSLTNSPVPVFIGSRFLQTVVLLISFITLKVCTSVCVCVCAWGEVCVLLNPPLLLLWGCLVVVCPDCGWGPSNWIPLRVCVRVCVLTYPHIHVHVCVWGVVVSVWEVWNAMV